VVLVLASAAFLPLLVPRLLPALALVIVIPLLSQSGPQGSLELHYFVVPSTVALVLAAVALRDRVTRDGLAIGNLRIDRRAWPVGVFAVPAALFVALSPLPPSVSAEWGRFDVDDHASVAQSFIGEIPDDAAVSAQSPFVPHLAERKNIYQFPRVLDAEFVLLDEYGPIPGEDLAAGYNACLGYLPRLGFDQVRTEDGISLWRKTRPSEQVPEAPPECSGQ
jgi:hypothetical protein